MPDADIIAVRRHLAAQPVTLDDVPATVCGIRNPTACIQDTDGLTVEFSWDTVRHIIDNRQGAFRS